MSAIQTATYINFQGHAREALEFYQQALGGELTLLTMDEQGQTRPAEADERVATGRLVADGIVIIGSDGHPRFPPTVGDNMAIALVGTDRERLTQAFNLLAEGGKIKGPLSAQPWGAEVGWFVDQFGLNWMVSIEQA
ncbi:MAG: VOC family protein [Chloroflexota bacterium]|nr:VOC family protein [Chloroflexota bacterium]